MGQYGLKKTCMFTVYGMAEASLAVAFPKPEVEFGTVFVDRQYIGIGQRVKEIGCNYNNAIGFVEEGKPVKYCSIRICDGNNNELDDRVIGHIQIRGRNVTKGYYNNPKANEKHITKDGWLRTGDIGFMREGSLIVTGRFKDIIFVNGQNFYPQDIERVVENSVGIGMGKVAATSISDNKSKREDLVVFVLFKKAPEAFVPIALTVKACLREQLGLFAKEVIPVKKIYKTTSGKVQRHKFVELFEIGEFDAAINIMEECVRKDRISNSDDQVREIEKSVLSICQDVVKINNLGLNDNFFEARINSLMIASLASSIQENFNVEIVLTDLYKLSTAKQLASFIEERINDSIYPFCINELKSRTKCDSIEVLGLGNGNSSEYYKASAAQKRLYVVDRMDLDTIGPNIGYNMPEALLIEGELDMERFNEAFNTLIKRHEALRTSFEILEDEPVQKIHSTIPFKVDYYEISKEEANDLMKTFIQPFKLDKPPIIRATVAKIEKSKYVLMIDMHHIISDGWSMMILIKELILLLEGKELPELRLQFKDFAAWQNKLLSSDIMKTKEKYWLNRFPERESCDIPVLNIPTDFPRPATKTYEGDRVILIRSRSLLESMDSVVLKTSSTLHMVMLAVYNVLLSKYSGQEDIIVGSPISGRPHRDLQNVFGMFVNMLVNRNTIKQDMTFREFLEQVKENCVNAYQNQEYQFDDLVGKLNLKRDMSRNPIFDYVFAVQNLDIPDISGSKIRVTPYDFEYKISRFDMFLSIMLIENEARFMLEYSQSLFKRSTAEKFLTHYMEIMEHVKADVDIKLRDITLSHNFTQVKNSILEDDGDFAF